MNQILEILQDIRPDYDFASSPNFIVDSLLDSFDIITLTSELEENYAIRIQTEDIVPENYQNIDSIANLVRKYGGIV